MLPNQETNMAVHSPFYLFLQITNHVFAGARGQCAALDFWNNAGKSLVQAIGRVFNRDISVPVIGREYFKAVHGLNALRVVVIEAMRYLNPSEPLEGRPRRFYSNVAVLFLAASHLSSRPAIFGIAKAAEVLSMTAETKSCWRNRNGFWFREQLIQESSAAQACKALKIALFFLTNGIIFLSWIGYKLSPQAKKIFTGLAIANSTVNFVNQFFNAYLLFRLSKINERLRNPIPPIPPLALSRLPRPPVADDSTLCTHSCAHWHPDPALHSAPSSPTAPPESKQPTPLPPATLPPQPSVSVWDSTVSSDFLTPAGQDEIDFLYASLLDLMHAISSVASLIGPPSNPSSAFSSQVTLPGLSPRAPRAGTDTPPARVPPPPSPPGRS